MRESGAHRDPRLHKLRATQPFKSAKIRSAVIRRAALTIARTTSNIRLPEFNPSCTVSFAMLAWCKPKLTSLPVLASNVRAIRLRSYSAGAHQLVAMAQIEWMSEGCGKFECVGGSARRERKRARCRRRGRLGTSSKKASTLRKGGWGFSWISGRNWDGSSGSGELQSNGEWRLTDHSPRAVRVSLVAILARTDPSGAVAAPPRPFAAAC